MSIDRGIQPGLTRAWGDGLTSQAAHTIVDTRMRSATGEYWTECSCGIIITVPYRKLDMSDQAAGDLYAEVLAERYATHVHSGREATRAQLTA